MKRYLVFILLSGFFFLPVMPLHGADMHGQGLKSPAPRRCRIILPCPRPAKRSRSGKAIYLIYGFDKKPKLGTVIMKVEIFTADGKKDTSFEVKADAGMPSMRGAHETGDRPFKLSKKGDYLLPIIIVMPGDWEIRLTVIKDGKVIFRGRYNFNV